MVESFFIELNSLMSLTVQKYASIIYKKNLEKLNLKQNLNL